MLSPSKHVNDTISKRYGAIVETSCYCRDEYIDMMEQNPNTLCIFHESCDRMVNNTRAFWLSPHHPRYIFPSALPMPPNHEKSIERTSPSFPLNMCVIGSPGRRNFRFLKAYLQLIPEQMRAQNVRLNLLGKGDFPESLEDYRNITTQETIRDFVTFLHTVATRCDILLPLIDAKTSSGYFNKSTSKKKLSGSIVQAVAYHIPMVIHEDLSQLYSAERDATTRWETHTNDPLSFAFALAKLVDSLVGGNATIVAIEKLNAESVQVSTTS